MLHGPTPFELVTGNTPDISEYISFEWYQPIWYYDSTSFPEPARHLGRWIGVAHNTGQAMCFWILPISGIPIACTTEQALTELDLRDSNIQELFKKFDVAIHEKIGDQTTSEDALAFKIGSEEFTKALKEADDDGNFHPIEPEAEKSDPDDYDEETDSQFLSAEVKLSKGSYEYVAKVIGRKHDADGNPIGRYHPNPLLDTTNHEVQFPDDVIQDYAANVIAESLYAQIDGDGNSALSNEDQQTNQRCLTTKGWNFCCQWADDSTSREPLRNLKESNPVKLAEYAAAHDLLNAPAFKWWAKHALHKKKRIIA